MSMRRFMFGMAALCVLAGTPRAFAQVVYTATLSGTAEIPPTSTAGTGSATLTYFPDTSTMILSMNFAGLASDTTSAHVHWVLPR